MSYIIQNNDVVSNMFINKLSRYPECSRFVSYKTLDCYGHKVVDFLNNQSMKTVWFCSRTDIEELLHYYKDYFIECKVNGELGIKLKESITINDLIVKFRGYLPIEILLAFCNTDIFECGENEKKED